MTFGMSQRFLKTGYAFPALRLTRFRREVPAPRTESTVSREGRIPAERMKKRRPHLVPLAPQAVELIKSLQKMTGKNQFLFPANTVTRVMSENTLLFALYRMGYHSRATAHGFRSTASTALNEAQFNRDWIEAQLAHADRSVRGVYNSAQWLTGRRKMMCWWADFVERKQRV